MSGPEGATPDPGDAGAGQQAEDWGARLSRARAVLAAQPFSAMLGAQLSALSADGVELRLPVSVALTQQHGVVHGGVVAYLADNALASAGGLRLAAGRVATAEMKINYVRPATGDGLRAAERLCAAAPGTIVAAGAPPAPSGAA